MTEKELRAKEKEKTEERTWVSSQIALAVDASKPHGWRRAIWLAKEHGSVAAYIAILLTAIYAAWTQHQTATSFAVKNQQFEDGTTGHFEKLEGRQKDVEAAIANLTLSVSLLRPVTSGSAAIVEKAIQSAIDNRTRLDPTLVQEAGNQMLQAPKVLGAWNTLARLASYRYAEGGDKPDLPNCNDLTNPTKVSEIRTDPEHGVHRILPIGSLHSDQIGFSRTVLQFSGCTLNLNTAANGKDTTVGRWLARPGENSVPGTPVSWELDLTNVRLVYDGGPMIPATEIRLKNCTVDFRLGPSSPARALDITRQLLLAATPQNATISVGMG